MLYVVGSLNGDITLPVEHLPRPGSTVLARGEPVRSGGGKGGNVAVAAARDGRSVRLVAAVGDDEAGAASLDELRADGVDTASVAVLDDEPTGLAMICVDERGDNFVVVASGANAALSTALVASGLADLAPGDVCVVNFEVPSAATDEAARTAAERGVRLLVNPSPVRELTAEILGVSPVLVANADEIRELTGEADLAAGALALLESGCETVVVTLGAAGARVTTKDGKHAQIAAHPANPVDTTGAGDTFAGVLAGGLEAGADIVASAHRAAVAAALSTERVGARSAMPTSAEIDAHLQTGRAAPTGRTPC